MVFLLMAPIIYNIKLVTSLWPKNCLWPGHCSLFSILSLTSPLILLCDHLHDKANTPHIPISLKCSLLAILVLQSCSLRLSCYYTLIFYAWNPFSFFSFCYFPVSVLLVWSQKQELCFTPFCIPTSGHILKSKQVS